MLCIITGVVQLPNGGEISRNTEVDAKANVSTSVSIYRIIGYDF